MEEWRKLMDLPEKESLQFFDSLSKNNNKEYENIITQVMLGCMLVDFEQNIFRLAIRNYKNKDTVYVWTFYNKDNSLYKDLSVEIEERYRPYGALFEYEDTPAEFQIEKVKNRKPPKGKKMTYAQKIIAWREAQPQGSEYKIERLLRETKLTNKQLQKAKDKNKVLAKILESDKTEKKGYYIKR
jgi:hypothetical protein